MRSIIRPKPTPVLIWIVVALLTAGLMACRGATRPVNFYTLSTLNTDASMPDLPPNSRGAAIGVGPLTLLKAVERPQIATRTGSNTIHVAEYHRWAGSLGRDMLNVIVDDLTLLLKSERVAAYPWERYFEPDYRVYIDVRALDCRLGKSADLRAAWIITDGEHALVSSGNEAFSVEVSGDQYENLVSAASSAVSMLSAEIAKQLSRLELGE